jgi:hypothetical protein
MILSKKYEVRLFIILTNFKDGNWYYRFCDLKLMFKMPRFNKI